LNESKQYLDFSKILNFLIDNPDVVNINSYLDKDWRENQKKLSKLILKNNV
jgi:hypothetical protein